ncbi:MAG: ferrous iron transport protein A [Candidatus Stahlbacteria bacterium]|nr:ferrous iron transport protein A [Candidatus Stahlbacteria bacterium]
MKLSLVDMRTGESGKIVEIYGGYNTIRRLDAMGIREGVEIKKLSAQFMRGPVMIQVGNTQIGIGFGMARRILVEIEGKDKGVKLVNREGGK